MHSRWPVASPRALLPSNLHVNKRDNLAAPAPLAQNNETSLILIPDTAEPETDGHFSSLWLWFGYPLAILTAELKIAESPIVGILIHSVLLVALLCDASFGAQAKRSLLLALALIPIARISSLGLPLVAAEVDDLWYLLSAVPLLVASLIVARQIGLSRLDLNLRVGSLPVQLAIGLLGIPIGIIEYMTLQPAPLTGEPSWETIWPPVMALVISSGFADELVFRGVLQATSLATLGRRGLIFASFVFAIHRLGNGSVVDALLLFCVGLLFAWLVWDSLSLLGVSLAQGLAGVMIYLILPFVSFQISFGGATQPQWAEAPPVEEQAIEEPSNTDYHRPSEYANPTPLGSESAPIRELSPTTAPTAQPNRPSSDSTLENYLPPEDTTASLEEEVVVAGATPEPIPLKPAAPAVLAFDTERYVVKPGDTLFGIAVKHGATLDLLKELNERHDNTEVLPGQVLVVPVGFPRKWEDYEVRSGDDLSGIASARASTREAIGYVNGFPADAELQEGQHLLVPPPRH